MCGEYIRWKRGIQMEQRRHKSDFSAPPAIPVPGTGRPRVISPA
jgi:hypothetical protein